MITKFNIFEDKDYELRVGDYVLAQTRKNTIGGEPAEIFDISPTKYGVKMLNQNNKMFFLYREYIITKITKNQALSLVKKGYKFKIGDIVKRLTLKRFFKIEERTYDDDLEILYYIVDEFHEQIYGWIKEKRIRELTPEEQKEYYIIKNSLIYNL